MGRITGHGPLTYNQQRARLALGFSVASGLCIALAMACTPAAKNEETPVHDNSPEKPCECDDNGFPDFRIASLQDPLTGQSYDFGVPGEPDSF